MHIQQKCGKKFKLTQHIAKCENRFLTTQMLAKAKKSIWHNINANIIDLWPSFEIILEWQELVQNLKATIEQTKVEVEHGPTKAHKIIKMLNSKTKDKIEELQNSRQNRHSHGSKDIYDIEEPYDTSRKQMQRVRTIGEKI